MTDTNISQLVPDQNPNWTVRNGMIYYRKLCDIAVLSEMDGVIWISLDRRITKRIVRIISHLIGMGVPFFLTHRFIVHKDRIDSEDLRTIISNYFSAITDPVFFDSFNEMGFDYVRNITDFMVRYECLDQMGPIFEKVKSHYFRTWTDWYSGEVYYYLDREDIRDFLSSLDREIKLSLLI